MIDYQNLPDNSKVDWFMQPTSTNEVHTWTKPSGCNFVYMIAVGGGTRGGNGFSRVAGAAGGGGGGGASGTLSTLLVPAFLIPDSLYIRVGRGSGISAVVATQTNISAYRISSATEYFLTSLIGGVAGNGVGTAPGAQGNANAATTILNNTLASIGKWQSSGGNAGVPGGAVAGAVGRDVTFNNLLTGGASGAGTTSGNFAGGNILSAYGQTSAVAVVKGGEAIAGATAGQNDGNSGFYIPKRFAFYGGGGGGSSNTGVGGNGGKGGPGCGGGGGGAGTTGGQGGDGGDGFAIIISY